MRSCPAAAAAILLIGQSGTVARGLATGLQEAGYPLDVMSGAAASEASSAALAERCRGKLVVVAVLEFASAAIVAKLPPECRVLDVSPAFRLHPEWVYGTSLCAGDAARVRPAQRVANPGCFATAAIVLLRPLAQAHLLGKAGQPVYLDAVGAASAGGEQLQAAAGGPDFEATSVFSLGRAHRHIEEIAAHAMLACPVWFSPKIGHHESGVLMQLPLPGVPRETAWAVLDATYHATEVRVFADTPNRLSAAAWANRDGAGIYVYERPEGSLAVCCLDNLREGSVSSGVRNVRLMLSEGAG